VCSHPSASRDERWSAAASTSPTPNRRNVDLQTEIADGSADGAEKVGLMRNCRGSHGHELGSRAPGVELSPEPGSERRLACRVLLIVYPLPMAENRRDSPGP
jgi:hypothetical protein